MLYKMENKIMRNRHFKISFLLIVFFLTVSLLQAQDATKQLVVTEVYLDSTNREVWIEIFNPSDETLSLNSMRISGIRRPSVLPREYEGQKSIELKPGERMIVCSDIQSFRKKHGTRIRAADLKIMEKLLGGGFIAINNLTDTGSKNNVVRIGASGKSRGLSAIVGDDQVLNITEDGKSYARMIQNNKEISVWFKAIPRPGQAKERGNEQ